MTNMVASSREQQRDVASSEDESSAPVSTGDLRRGPWTVEEDLLLVNYIAAHGEGRWNALARCAGLKRTGKSCRLRWLNYLRPDLRRGNITAQEQLLILELHSRWGNRWSKIAQHLPGRTDNEIKNYWRTRVQKHARQLNCDVNSQQFKDLMRYLWMPRLLERINSSSSYDDVVLVAPAADDAAAAANNNEVELSSLVSPPPMDCCCWSSSCSDNNNNSRSMMSAWPHTSSSTPAAVHDQLAGAAAAETCWRPEAPAGLSGTSTSVYGGDMTLPDLLDDETMWAAADDLWYTQIMGL